MRASSGRPHSRSTDASTERANGPACTPGSVRGPEPRGRSSLSATRCRAAPAAYPGTRRAASSSPVWPCSGRGLPCGSRHRDPGGLLHHPFTLTPALTGRGGLLSVALSRGLLRVGVTHRPALWSPDVPRREANPATRPSSRPIRGAESSGVTCVTARDQSLSADSAIRTSSGKSIGKSPNSSRAADAAASRTATAASSA